jgi:hypothetical protein
MKSKTSGIDTIKTQVGGSDDDGDKNPPRKSLERIHVACTAIKRKRNLSSMEINTSKVKESPRAMDMDKIIEEPEWFAQRLLDMREIVEAIMTQVSEIFEGESVTLHHTAYNHETKKLLLEKFNTMKKKSSE